MKKTAKNTKKQLKPNLMRTDLFTVQALMSGTKISACEEHIKSIQFSKDHLATNIFSI